MTQHFTRNTVSVAFYCKKCERVTQHRIDDGRKGPCMACMLKLDEIRRDRRAQQEQEITERQEKLF